MPTSKSVLRSCCIEDHADGLELGFSTLAGNGFNLYEGYRTDITFLAESFRDSYAVWLARSLAIKVRYQRLRGMRYNRSIGHQRLVQWRAPTFLSSLSSSECQLVVCS